MGPSNLSLFSKVKYYLKLSKELQAYLSKYPDHWQKFQEDFNKNVDGIYQEILEFEKTNMDKSETKVYKLKKIFEKRYRRFFLYGEFIKWSYEKPFGYSGDFKIIDDIYQNHPNTVGFDRLWDNYFQQLAAVKATRERKEDFKKIILDSVKDNHEQNIRIMNLGSGSAREIKELLVSNPGLLFPKVIFDCYDFDINAINYAKKILNKVKNVNLLQKNAIRLALKNDITKEIPWKYALIYSTGLFDYLDERVAIRLISNLKKLLRKNGLIVISNARDKYHNSSAGWMEWVADWNLIYRSREEFKQIFLDAGFLPEKILIVPQRTKVMQYCFAHI